MVCVTVVVKNALNHSPGQYYQLMLVGLRRDMIRFMNGEPTRFAHWDRVRGNIRRYLLEIEEALKELWSLIPWYMIYREETEDQWTALDRRLGNTEPVLTPAANLLLGFGPPGPLPTPMSRPKVKAKPKRQAAIAAAPKRKRKQPEPTVTPGALAKPETSTTAMDERPDDDGQEGKEEKKDDEEGEKQKQPTIADDDESVTKQKKQRTTAPVSTTLSGDSSSSASRHELA